MKLSVGSFLWHFETIKINPLARIDSLHLFNRLTDDLQLTELMWIQNKVFDTSEGNPRMLAERIRPEPVVDAYVIDEHGNSYLVRQTRQIDVSPTRLLLSSADCLYATTLVAKPASRDLRESAKTNETAAVSFSLLYFRFVTTSVLIEAGNCSCCHCCSRSLPSLFIAFKA